MYRVGDDYSVARQLFLLTFLCGERIINVLKRMQKQIADPGKAGFPDFSVSWSKRKIEMSSYTPCSPVFQLVLYS